MWLYGSFALAALAAEALTVGDPYVSSLSSNRTWDSLRLLNSPVLP